jgi:tetratricopeptide (TPR) repeat protein
MALSQDNKNTFEAIIQMGFAHHAKNEFHEASNFYQKAYLINPENFDVLQLIGALLSQTGKFLDAIGYFIKALDINPNHADCNYNLGHTFQQCNLFKEALSSYQKALLIEPNNLEALNNSGVILEKFGKFEESLQLYEKIIIIDSNFIQAYYNKANVLKTLRKYDEALKFYDKCIAIKPDYLEPYINRATVLKSINQPQEALKSLEQALAINPKNIEARSNYGNLLHDLNLLDEALKNHDVAINAKPECPEIYNNRALTLKDLQRTEESFNDYARAIELNPHYHEAIFNRSLLLLMTEDYRTGWKEYESRWESEAVKSTLGRFERDIPEWRGEALIRDKKLLINCEQGLGDIIQFCRYVPLLEKKGAKVVLEVPNALFDIASSLQGISQIIKWGEPYSGCDYQCPLLSLPLVFKTEIDTIPNEVPYLHAKPQLIDSWKIKLSDHGFKIGISWEGSKMAGGELRKIPLQMFKGIAKIDGVRLISLQKNQGSEQISDSGLSFKVEDLGSDFDSSSGPFMDSAAVIKNLDLVITCDSAIGHLSGALGAPTWLPLIYAPHWIWLLDRDDSPWYPNHRLFRQMKPGEWGPVFEQIEYALKEIMGKRI